MYVHSFKILQIVLACQTHPEILYSCVRAHAFGLASSLKSKKSGQPHARGSDTCVMYTLYAWQSIVRQVQTTHGHECCKYERSSYVQIKVKVASHRGGPVVPTYIT